MEKDKKKDKENSAPLDTDVLNDVSTVNEITNNKYNVNDIDICNACSTSDCTGLVARPPKDEAETASYHDIYTFGPPDLD